MTELRGESNDSLRPGAKFLKYHIVERIGRGDRSSVYSGYDPFMSRHVAIKILSRPGGVTREMLQRSQGEAKLLSRLRHKNIVEVYDAGVTDSGFPYIVMELLRGRTLRAALEEHGKLAIEEVLHLFAQIADGLAKAHEEGAIHRDLKPENLFLSEGNCPKILDFGLAKIADGAAFATQPNVVHGTLLYMSPEQLQGALSTPRSDIYSLGTTLFEALYGKPPCLLANPHPTIKELALAQAQLLAPRLDRLDSNIPEYVAKMVSRALAKLPDERQSSMTELAAQLRDCQVRYLEDVERSQHRLSTRELSRPRATRLEAKRLAKLAGPAAAETPAKDVAAGVGKNSTQGVSFPTRYVTLGAILLGGFVGSVLAATHLGASSAQLPPRTPPSAHLAAATPGELETHSSVGSALAPRADLPAASADAAAAPEAPPNPHPEPELEIVEGPTPGHDSAATSSVSGVSANSNTSAALSPALATDHARAAEPKATTEAFARRAQLTEARAPAEAHWSGKAAQSPSTPSSPAQAAAVTPPHAAPPAKPAAVGATASQAAKRARDDQARESQARRDLLDQALQWFERDLKKSDSTGERSSSSARVPKEAR
ncbi:MAG TPA: serine/threonine-protein kinase [Polyangiaceae bacterium]|nr:serine/threonine-protein kinase [Polyangiaceae bacterium]